MPPSVAAPLLVPAAGIGGGAPAPTTSSEPDPSDPGSWAGAGFGPPRDDETGRPADSSAPSGQSSGQRPTGTTTAPEVSSGSYGRGGPPSGSTSAPAEVPAGPYGRGGPPSGSSSAPAESGPGAAPQPTPDPPTLSSRGSSSAQASVAPAELTPGALAWLAAAGGTPPPAPGPTHSSSSTAGGSSPASGRGSSGRGDTNTARFPAPTRPPLRPQTVADSRPFRSQAVPSASAPSSSSSSGRAATSVALRPVPPDLPLEVPAARPEQPPELATSDVPAVAADQGAAPVDDLFARLRHQVPGAEAGSANRPPAPAPAGPADDVVDETALARRDQQLDPLDADLTRALKRILQDEQNEVLEGLRQGGRQGVSTLVAALDPQRSGYRVAAAPTLASAYRAGGGAADDQTGPTLGGRLAHDLVTPLKARLQRVVASAGDDMEELAEAIRAAYRHAKLQEIEQLVRHHTAAAHALGAFASTPGGTTLRWVVDDEGPCPDCHDNALAGPTPRGDAYPTGQKHPPAHLGCRCLLVPAAT